MSVATCPAIPADLDARRGRKIAPAAVAPGVASQSLRTSDLPESVRDRVATAAAVALAAGVALLAATVVALLATASSVTQADDADLLEEASTQVAPWP